jgi:hypothetical protein
MWAAFKYLNHGYRLTPDGIIPYAFQYGYVPKGFLKFNAATTAAIRIWCANDGFAGMSIEDYLDQVLGSAK